MLRNSILALCVGGCGLLAGCTDYMNNLDTVTLEAGNAQAYNRLLHTNKNFNPDSADVDLQTSGKRAADAQQVYEEGLKKIPPPRGTTLTIKAE